MNPNSCKQLYENVNCNNNNNSNDNKRLLNIIFIPICFPSYIYTIFRRCDINWIFKYYLLFDYY